MNRLLPVCIAALLVPGLLAQAPAQPAERPAPEGVAQPAASPAPATSPAPAATQPPEAKDSFHPLVKLETTMGDIILELDAENAPISTDNFIEYVKAGYYDGTIFHRVISDFMVQGGGFTPEGKQKTEGLRPPIKNEWQNGLKNARGTVAMARTAVADSATSQFFINTVDNTAGSRRDLDTPRPGPGGPAAYAVFGKVVQGMDVVDQVRTQPVKPNPGNPMEQSAPLEPVVVKSAKLISPYDNSKLAEAERKIADAKKQEEQAKVKAEIEAQLRMNELIEKTEKETGKKAQETPSGLKYIVLQEGTGEQPPSKEAMVEVHYTGWLVDGTKFDSSVDRGQPAKFPLNRVIPGWTEGVGSMKVGEKRKLFIPPNLGYGQRGQPMAKIPPNAWLVFDVELLGIVQNGAQP